MGNDVDDALALDMLYKYADQRKIRLLAINSNKNNISSPEFIDIMNTWYGHPDIPVGKVVNGVNSENDAINYTQVVRDYKPSFKKHMLIQQDIPMRSYCTGSYYLKQRIIRW